MVKRRLVRAPGAAEMGDAVDPNVKLLEELFEALGQFLASG